jgi:hypothetical protein
VPRQREKVPRRDEPGVREFMSAINQT